MFEMRGTLRKWLIVTVVLFTLVIPAKVWAVTTGSCGANVTYVLDDAGTLTISGSGEMSNYTGQLPNNFPETYRKYYTPSPFCDNHSIKRVIIKSGVTSIGSSMFDSCKGLISVQIPNGIKKICGSAFRYCSSLETVHLPDSVTEICSQAFTYCTGLKNINIPAGVTTLGSSAFDECTSLTKIEIPSGIDKIDGWTFENCSSLSEVVINPGIKSIHKDAFGGCTSLKSIVIPSGVENLYYYSFEQCSSLESIELPASLSQIDNCAFLGCGNLKYVYYRGTQAQWDQIAILRENGDLTSAYIHYNSKLDQHAPVKTAAKASTCTEEGNIEYYTCDVCGKLFSDAAGAKTITQEQTVTAAKGHALTKTSAKAATCTEPGNIEYYTCSVCGKLFSDAAGTQEVAEAKTEIKAKGHTVVTDPAVPATKTSPGKTEGSHCSVCGTVLKAQDTVPAAGQPGDDAARNNDEKDKKEKEPDAGKDADTGKNADTGKDADTGANTGKETAKGDPKDKTSVAGVEKALSTLSGDKDAANSDFITLRAKALKTTKNSIKLGWTKVKKASGYIVYGAMRGKRFEKVGDVSGKKGSFTHKKLKKGMYYKYIVVAYQVKNGTQKVLATSKNVVAATAGGTFTNYKSVKADQTTVKVAKGRKVRVKAAAVVPAGKKVKQYRKVKFETSSKKIATVDKNGVIKGKKKGTCYVYAYAQNGVFKKIKVVVK